MASGRASGVREVCTEIEGETVSFKNPQTHNKHEDTYRHFLATEVCVTMISACTTPQVYRRKRGLPVFNLHGAPIGPELARSVKRVLFAERDELIDENQH